MKANSGVEIKSARGTIYFVREGEGLKQAFELVLDNRGTEIDGRLRVRWESDEFSTVLESIPQGQSFFLVYLPDIRRAVNMIFTLEGCETELVVEHKPQRHWTVHIVQFSHHDFGYTDLPSRVINEHCRFYDDVLRFCRETDSFPNDSKFRYTIEQGWSLLHWLEHRPVEAREEMFRWLREGRIEVNAFLGNETTELLGSEEMVRLLYPVFALKRYFSVPVTTAENNDIPGLSWGIASVLAGAGIRYFISGHSDYEYDKPYQSSVWDEEKVSPGKRPHAFYWEAINGEKVLFWHHNQGVGGDADFSLGKLPCYLEELESKDYPYDVVRYLVRGAMRDNSPPSIEFCRAIKEWNSKWTYPRFVSSLNSMFFPELEKQLSDDTPTWRGEIPGTDYTVGASSTAKPTSANRKAHDELLAAERFAVVASSAASLTYPKQQISEAYYCTLMYDEHTWGMAQPAGPAQDACVAQLSEYAYQAAALAHDIMTKSINKIADCIHLEDEGYYVVVFNPSERVRTDLATVSASPLKLCALVIGDNSVPYRTHPVYGRSMAEIPIEMIENGFEVIDVSSGKSVPYQINEITDPLAPVPYAPERYSLGAHNPGQRFDIQFTTEDVPAMGWKTYRLMPAAKQEQVEGIQASGNSIENRFYRVEVDPATGAIASIFDKELGRELVDRDAKYRVNQVVVRSSVTGEEFGPGSAVVMSGKVGPVSGSLIVKNSSEGCPQIVQEIMLYADIKRIEIANRILKDPTPMLEVFFAFPFAFNKPKVRYEAPLCVVEPAVDQFPGSNTNCYAAQHWADVSDCECGVTLTSIDAPVMQFGSNWPLRTSINHRGIKTPSSNQSTEMRVADNGHIYSLVMANNFCTNFAISQSGSMIFRYSITSHAGDWKDGDAAGFGYSVSLPFPHAIVKGRQDGHLVPLDGFFKVEPENVVLLALKQAEDEMGIVVRLLETAGLGTDVIVTLPFISIKDCVKTNIVEESQTNLPHTAHSVKATVRMHSTLTIKVIPS